MCRALCVIIYLQSSPEGLVYMKGLEECGVSVMQTSEPVPLQPCYIHIIAKFFLYIKN